MSLQTWLIKQGIKYLIRRWEEMGMMKGWKTWVAGLGAIFSGLGIVIHCITSGDYSKFNEGLMLIWTGLGMIGIGHKIEKNSGRQ